ncbi:MAG TPA: ATP-dependent DNA ligase [Nitrososphaeraceae archaeon]|nr:ATP-dependent DNA ligase [Nitrososphaeraceae archaeon]
MDLSLLIETFEEMEKTTSRISLTSNLVDLFKKTPGEIIDKVVYLIQGKLAPDYESLELGLAEKMALRAIAYSSGSPLSSVEKVYHITGDIGDAAGQIMKSRNQTTLHSYPMTVERVFSTLEKIAKTAGPGSQESKLRLLSSILNDTKPRESRYIMKFVMGTLRLGIADFTVMDALALAFTGSKSNRTLLERAYNVTSDLGTIAKTLAKQGLESIKSLQIVLFKPVRPMLAERVTTTEDALERMDGHGLAEYKLDGERIQVHKDSGTVELFTRRLDRITHHFPDIVQSVKSLSVSQAIMEGEVVAIDINTGAYLPFQLLMRRRRKHGINEAMENYPVVINFFDLLYVNGNETTSMPLSKRRALLEDIINNDTRIKKSSLQTAKSRSDEARTTSENDGSDISDRQLNEKGGDNHNRMKLVPQATVTEPLQVEKFMASAIENGCEGLMVKHPNSAYRAGAREFAWVKLKREYRLELADTLDLVVVGALYGRGRRVGKYGALLLAAYDTKADQFRSTTKVGTGFTDESLGQFFKDLERLIIPHKHPRVDTGMKMDVWFEPKMVIEIIASEITLSPAHTAGINSLKEGFGLALRFPKFTGKIRDDKKPEDATAVGELINMYKQQSRSSK